jgi:hypothetical protein
MPSMIRQLDGLGYEEVTGLAGATLRVQLQADLRGHRVDVTPTIDATTGRLLNEAIQALHAHKYSESRAMIGRLNPRKLSPFERSETEQLLFEISYIDANYAEAREHLESAIAAVVQTSMTQIRFIASSRVLNLFLPIPWCPEAATTFIEEPELIERILAHRCTGHQPRPGWAAYGGLNSARFRRASCWDRPRAPR